MNKLLNIGQHGPVHEADGKTLKQNDPFVTDDQTNSYGDNEHFWVGQLPRGKDADVDAKSVNKKRRNI